MHGVADRHRITYLPRALRRLLAGLLLLVAGAAQAEPSKLALTKAAFVFNFSKYTEWPARAFSADDSAISLCIFDAKSDVGQALSKIDGKQARERVVRVRVLAPGAAPAGCHILYFERSSHAAVSANLQALAGSPVLTVSDSEGFAALGGVIELVPSELRLGFEVNLHAAEQAELRLSSQLLALARTVKRT